MIEIIYFLWILLLSFFLGKKLFYLLNIKFKALSEEFLFSISIGLAVLSYIIFFLGIFGLLYPFLINIILIFLFIILLPEIKNYLMNLQYIRKSNYFKFSKFGFNEILIIIIFLFFLINFLSSFAPVVEIDSLSYHLALPKIYINNNRIFYMPSIMFSSYPFFVEMLYITGLSINSPAISQLFIFSFSVLTALLIFIFTKKYFSVRTGLIAALIFYTLPIISERASQPMIEIPFAFYSSLAVYSFFEWFFFNNKRFLILSAVMAGISASIRHTGLGIIAIIILFIFYKSFVLEKKGIKAIKIILLFFLISLIICFPWYFRSYVYTGNPFFNFFYNIFGGANWNNNVDYHQYLVVSKYGMGKDAFSYLLLPWNTTMYGEKFDEFLGITPLFLSFLPILLIFKKRDPMIKYLLLFSLIFSIFWFFTSQQSRLLLPIFPLLAICTAYVINKLINKNIFGMLIMFIVIFTFLFNLMINIGININKMPVVFGFESEEKYLENLKDFNPYNISEYANQNLKSSSMVLLFGESRGYYLDLPYMWGHSTTQGVIEYYKMENEEELLKRLQSLGVTHILINWNYLPMIEREQKSRDLMTKLIEKYSIVVYYHQNFYLYKLTY